MTPSREPALGAATGARPPRLLVVDDQPVNIQALFQIFQADHQVLMATGGEQALKVAAERAPDLVLLDVEMPGMDGHEVCRQLRADARTKDIPVIFVTAHSDEASELSGLESGAVDFISKPVNPTIVRARVRTHLTLKAQADLLREWVYIDGLTGVRNRRCFDDRLAQEWARAARDGRPLSVVLADVDFFKRYNDHHGHQSGDDCLRQVAEAMRASVLRPSDMVARYGGEEFVVLLPDTPLAGALQAAERITRSVDALAIAHAHSDAAAHVTVSMGVCSVQPGAGLEPAALVGEADRQLYRAKSGGRHRIEGVAI